MQAPTDAQDRLDVVVVVPTLNEAAQMEALSRNLLADPIFDRPGAALWVLDGGSTDGTREIVERLAGSDGRLRLIDNPERNQACAVNLAAQLAAQAGARRMVRIDAHSHYPDRFISGLLATLDAEQCDSVVVPMRTIGGDPMRDAAADLFNSWLGNGGSPHRSGKVRGFVEHGHHAGFDLDCYRRVGGYDPRFLANEDAELDKRIVAGGGRIFLENTLPIDYIPRGSIASTWRQMSRNGRFRVWTSVKHGEPLGRRQLMPIGVSLGLIGSLAAGLIWWPLALPAALYLALIIILSVQAARRLDPAHIARIAALAVTSHLAFGLGAIRGVMETRSASGPDFTESGADRRRLA